MCIVLRTPKSDTDRDGTYGLLPLCVRGSGIRPVAMEAAGRNQPNPIVSKGYSQWRVFTMQRQSPLPTPDDAKVETAPGSGYRDR